MDARRNLALWLAVLAFSGRALAAGKSAPPSVVGYVVLLLVMAGAGVLSIVDVMQKRARMRRARSWPMIEAQVVDTAIEQKARPTKVTPRFIPRLAYQFTVGGKSWMGTWLQYGDRCIAARRRRRNVWCPTRLAALPKCT